MRFIVRHLLLILSAFVLGAIGTLIFNLPGCVIYKWMVAIQDVRRIHSRVEDQVRNLPDSHRDKDIVVDAVNEWLAGKLPATQPVAEALYDSPHPDPWGKPYRCVRVSIPTSARGESIGIYSMGDDGISTSQGNDLDDLNSWNRESYRWYEHKINFRNRRNAATQFVLITTVAYLALIGFVPWFKPVDRGVASTEPVSVCDDEPAA